MIERPQIDLFLGVEKRDEELEKVASNAEDFMLKCRTYAAMHAMHYGRVTSDQVRAWAAQQGLAPHHQNAWGALFRGEPRPGYEWVQVGFEKSNLVSNHARRISVWAIRRKNDE